MAIRNRLYPAPGQQSALREHCSHARRVWNLAVEQQSWWRPGRGSPPAAAERYRQLTQARQAEPWLGAGSSSVQQQALRDFDRALVAFFDKTNPAGRPGYRSRRATQGFTIRDTRARRVSRRWGEVWVPKCGWVRFRWTRPLPGKLGAARVTCDRAGRWHVSFPAPQPPVARQRTGAEGRRRPRRGCRPGDLSWPALPGATDLRSPGGPVPGPATPPGPPAERIAAARADPPGHGAWSPPGSPTGVRTGPRSSAPGWSATTMSSSWRSSTLRA